MGMYMCMSLGVEFAWVNLPGLLGWIRVNIWNRIFICSDVFSFRFAAVFGHPRVRSEREQANLLDWLFGERCGDALPFRQGANILPVVRICRVATPPLDWLA